MKALAGVSKLATLTLTLFIPFQLWLAENNPISGQTAKDNKSTEKNVTPKGKDPRLQSIIDDIESLPPEFAADGLIRIAQSGLVESPKDKEELLKEAFRDAKDAQLQIKRIPYSDFGIDSRLTQGGRPIELSLDALSLRTRAVRAMLSVNKQRARELFTSMDAPHPETLNCDDKYVYDVSSFYELLRDIAQTTFTDSEKHRKEDLYFVKQYVDGLSSSVELGPASNLITSMASEQDGLLILLPAFIRALDHLPDDDRSFTVYARNGLISDSMYGLIKKSRTQPTLRAQLKVSYRDFIVRNLNGDRCVDNTSSSKGDITGIINRFNESISAAIDQNDKDIPIILSGDLKPSRIIPASPPIAYWQSADTKKIYDQYKALYIKPDGAKVKSDEKLRSDWQGRLSDFLTALEVWDRGTDMSEEDYFNQKSELYYRVLNIIPPVSLDYFRAFGDYLKFVADSPVQQNNREEWFLQMTSLFERAHSLKGEDAKKARAMLSDSENWVIRMYAILEILKPTPSDHP
ncbi:MAG TPA: hypothetical protein VFC63_12670 [Blastocatellia bacterium]|nr:hypothetical protein [Blastocatellia bacterium]